MATLVLTTVGGLVGGPIGAALGGILGQAIDRSVLGGSATRQGPRLTELAVQTSSYGSAIPRQFGTMRVAGTVIWSTDLIESRSTSSAGKGQPKTTTYSYRASFAVLLSARAVLGVRRIWADGNLLRGVAGDFKTACGFRLHLGSEEQSADPLIAAAEGETPAYRGCAYAVFEDLQLADFGNRIPSLTFEVIADAGAVTIGAVAEDVSGGVVEGSGAATPLAGFSAYGESVRGVLETLAQAGGAWFAAEGARVRMLTAGDAAVEIADAGVSASARGTRRTRAIAAADAAARSVALAYYDPARDYQAGLQRARRPGAGTVETRIDLAAALSAEDAKALAEAVLARAGTAREKRTVAMDIGSLALRPGGCVTILGESGRWRIVTWSLEAMVLSVELERIARASVTVAASSGRVLGSPDTLAGRTIVAAFELPALGEELLASPRLLIAAAGEGAGWRRAALLVSTDDGARWTSAGQTAAPAVIGSVALPPGVGSAAIADLGGAFEVVLAHAGMELADADDAGLDQGANLALVGGELLQFGRAEPLGGARWRLSRLWRGRRGTEAAVAGHAAGERFVLIEAEALVAIDLPLAAVGGSARVLASGVGDTDGPAEDAAALSGVSVRPLAPVHLAVDLLQSGDAVVSWVRRSRIGWRWIDGAEAPLGEERELYRSAVEPAAGAVRAVESAVPSLVVTAAERAAGAVTVRVRQAGTNGDSAEATAMVPQL